MSPGAETEAQCVMERAQGGGLGAWTGLDGEVGCAISKIQTPV